MPNQTYRITGHVNDCNTHRGIVGLRAEAWDKDLIFDDLVGSAVTDDQGAFHMEFDESYFRELFLDRRHDLFFKVFRADELIKSTEDAVLWNVETCETDVVIEVDIGDGTVPEPQPFSVRGHIYRQDNTAFPELTVKAFDRDMRSEEPAAR